jgi:hypothetical protein
MILVYAGRRSASLPGDLDALARRIRRLVAGLGPSAVVGAAADGADLLVLEAALAIPQGPAAHVVLPTAREVFRAASVQEPWRARFDRALDAVGRAGGAVTTLDRPDGEDAYRRGNEAMLAHAGAVAGGGRVAVLLVGAPGEGAMIEDLAGRAALRAVPVLRIDPSVDIAARPTCFVAMPYGRKLDPQRKIELDCDLVYARILVPALEHAQLAYHRADEQIDAGIILAPMIDALSRADLVVGDLQTGNFNVGWELGLRHLMRPGHTLLVAPEGTSPPFDLSALRHVRYRYDERGLSDDAVVSAWELLAPHLAAVADGRPASNDSPVASVMEVERWGAVRRRAPRDERFEDLRAQLAVARDLLDAERMLALVAGLDGLTDAQARLLRAEAGVGLVRLRRYADARDLLRDAVRADASVQRPDAHLYYAQALYRPKDAGDADLEEAGAVLGQVLRLRPAHPEVRAHLGAVTKRRIMRAADPRGEAGAVRAALEHYRHGFGRDLNRYYEGINVVALAVVLARCHGDAAAAATARELLPAVRVAARLASARPAERYWAEATVAECALHEHVLDGAGGVAAVRRGYERAGEGRPPEGDLDSTLTQLDFLERVGLPADAIAAAREGLRAGAAGL